MIPFCRRYASAFACDMLGICPFVIGMTEVPGTLAAALCADGGLCWKFATAAAAALTGVVLERGGDACAATEGDAEPLWFIKLACRCC